MKVIIALVVGFTALGIGVLSNALVGDLGLLPSEYVREANFGEAIGVAIGVAGLILLWSRGRK